MKLTDNHFKLYQAILDRGIGKICNDLEPSEYLLLSKKEWKEFTKAYYTWNGNTEEEIEEITKQDLFDWQVVNFINYLLIENYKIHRSGK